MYINIKTCENVYGNTHLKGKTISNVRQCETTLQLDKASRRNIIICC